MSDPRGRPTKYDDSYPELVVQAMSNGMSISQFAALMAVCRATVYNWVDEHPEFAEAVEIGRTAFEAHWETRLQNALHDRTANAMLYKMYFAARMGWRDRTAIDHTSSDHSMKPATLDWSKLSSEALEEILNAQDTSGELGEKPLGDGLSRSERTYRAVKKGE